MAPTQKPEPGDLIEIFRIGYEHWAVYVGDGYVIHVTSATDVPGASANSLSSAPNKKAMVKREKLEDVVKNDKWKINNKLDKKYKPRSLITILKDANARVGMEMQYSVLKKNCEHFANELRYGEPESRQVVLAAAAAAAGAGVVGFLGTLAVVVIAVVRAVGQKS